MGLVGAGPWARIAHAPMLAAGPHTRLAAVWARRFDAATALAEAYGATACATYDELLDRCEAVAYCVPPDIQAELATRAAQAGKALLLEKPVALDLVAARRLADAAAGVVTQVVLTNRYHPAVRAFLDEAAGFGAFGARAAFVGDAFLGGHFSTPWRLRHGALLDLGPHVLDLLDAALGPIEEIHGVGDPRTWFAMTAVHAGGAVSDAVLSGAVPPPGRFSVELFGPAGTLALDTPLDHAVTWPVVAEEFAAAVRSGRSGPLDIRRGVMVQELVERAARRAG